MTGIKRLSVCDLSFQIERLKISSIGELENIIIEIIKDDREVAIREYVCHEMS